MKTLVLPVLDWRKVQAMDQDYLRLYWAQMLVQTGSWQAAMGRFIRTYATVQSGRDWLSYVLCVAFYHREEIEAVSYRVNAEAATPPLPGLWPDAARSAAPA